MSLETADPAIALPYSAEFPASLTVMISYASYGDGHLQAARAIQEALQSHGVRRIIMVDLMEAAHPRISALTRSIYNSCYRLFPGPYGWVYERTRDMRHDSLIGACLHALGRYRLNRLIAEHRPDAIIHTFPMYGAPLLPLQTKRRGSGPSHRVHEVSVITDYDLHGRWVHPLIERYYVPTLDMKHALAERGIPEERVCVSGMPLRASFSEAAAASRADVRLRYGFADEQPIVLIMANALGSSSEVADLCRALLTQSRCAIAVVCGRNSKLFRSIRHASPQCREAAARLRIFGYVNEMPELMAVSALIVTKPGGITLSEAMAAGLPILTYRPMPGQEVRNARYLAGQGTVVIAENHERLLDEIMQRISDPLRLIQCAAALTIQPKLSSEALVMDFLTKLSIIVGKIHPALPLRPAEPVPRDGSAIEQGAAFRSQRSNHSGLSP